MPSHPQPASIDRAEASLSVASSAPISNSVFATGIASRLTCSTDRADVTRQGVGARAASRLRRASREACAARGSDRQQSPGPSLAISGSYPEIPDRLRFVEVPGDNLEPHIRRRDFVLLAACEGYIGEGYYLVEKLPGYPGIYLCAPSGTRAEPTIRLGNHFTVYTDEFVTKERFDAIVVGKVAMTCRVQDPDLIRTSFAA